METATMFAVKTLARITPKQALDRAEEFVAENLGNLVDVGQPSRIVNGVRAAWIVPLLLASPGYGIVGVIGTVMVDEELGYMIGWTPIEEIRSNAEQITLQKQAGFEAAFLNLCATQSSLA